MHYYSFNIGDYASHTQRLSPLEDLAYRRLLDLYYLTERPINGCSTDVSREIGLSQYQQEVDYILSKYFTVTVDGYVNNRVDKEIKYYKDKQRMASKAGKASGKARQIKASEQTFNVCLTDDEPTIKHKPIPITNKYKPKIDSGRMTRPTLDELINEFDGRVLNSSKEADAFFNYYESNGWKVGKNSMKSWQHAVTNWIARDKAKNPPRTADKITELTNRSWATQKLEKT